jgi:hypothetical protein
VGNDYGQLSELPDECIAIAKVEGLEEDAQIYATYPAPSEKEWNECVQAVLDLQEDPGDPFNCMGQYELRLGKRGIKTVSGWSPMNAKQLVPESVCPWSSYRMPYVVGPHQKA